MIIEGILLSIIVGFIRKGKFRNFEHIQIKGWYFIFIGGLLQFIFRLLATTPTTSIGRWIESNFLIMHLFTYIIIIIPLVLNIKMLWTKILLIGTLLNLIPIALNDGRMPVKLPAHYSEQFDVGHVLYIETTKAKLLSDIFNIAKPYPLPHVASIGDFFLAIGAFLFVQYAMKLQPEQEILES